MKKISTLFFFLTLLFLPIATQAAANTNNCWEKQKCIDYRQKEFGLSTQEARAGFRITAESTKICNTDSSGKSTSFDGEYGFCLTSSATQTNISIGGRTNFNDLGDFIAYIYKYSFAAATIIAVIVIVLAGIQWILSAGNSNVVTSAKKRIGGAAVGIVLLATSYVVLNTINPYLVTFKTMDIYMVNENYYAPYCSQIKDQTVKLYTESTNNNSKAESVSSDLAVCGKTYYIEGDSNNTCQGSYCPGGGTMCALNSLTTSTYSCIDANITGKVVNNDILYLLSSLIGNLAFSEGWEWKWVQDPEIYVVCENGEYSELNTTKGNVEDNSTLQTQLYKVQLKNQNINTDSCYQKCKGGSCQKTDYIKGFVLRLEFNENEAPFIPDSDEEHFVGITDCNGANICTGVDLGDDRESILKAAQKKYFITADKLSQGITININMKNILDIDEDEQLSAYDYLKN